MNKYDKKSYPADMPLRERIRQRRLKLTAEYGPSGDYKYRDDEDTERPKPSMPRFSFIERNPPYDGQPVVIHRDQHHPTVHAARHLRDEGQGA